MIYLGLKMNLKQFKMDLSFLFAVLIIVVVALMSGLLWLVLKGFIVLGQILFFFIKIMLFGAFWVVSKIRGE